MNKRVARFPAFLLVGLFIIAVWLTWTNLSIALPRDQWRQAMWSPDVDAIGQMIFITACCQDWRFRCWWARVLGW